jgi:ribosomal protein L40E
MQALMQSLLQIEVRTASSLPVWVILFLAITAALILYTMLQHRRHMRNTSTKLCTGCGTSHPGFAKFCRHCGKHL